MFRVLRGFLPIILSGILLFPASVITAQECSLALPSYPIEDLEPSQKISVYTVSSGTDIEKLDLRVVGLAPHPAYNNERIVLFHTEGDGVVAAGMSGSPVCADDMIIGALAYSYGAFPRDNDLGGITPADAIKNQRLAFGAEPREAFPRQMDGPPFVPIPTNYPGNVKGSSGVFNDQLREMGYEGFSLMSFGENADTFSYETLYQGELAGQAVTMFLARGVMNVGATCTVTGEMSEGRVSMCGHPVIRHGSVSMPAYRSSIATTFKSDFGSFKLPGEALEPVGTVVYDNLFGVEIERTVDNLSIVPVSISISTQSETYEYELEVIRERPMTALLAAQATQGLLENIWGGYSEPAIAELSARIHFVGGRHADVYSYGKVAPVVVQRNQLVSIVSPWHNIITRLRSEIVRVQENELGILVDHIDISADLVPGGNVLEVEKTYILVNGEVSDEAEMGDTVSVAISLFDTGDPLSQLRWVRQFSFVVPESLDLVPPVNISQRSLPLQVYIMSGSYYEERDEIHLMALENLRTVDEYIDRMALELRDPSELFVQVVFPAEYTSSRGCGSGGQNLRFPAQWDTISVTSQNTPWCNVPSISQVLTESLGRPTQGSLLSVNEVHILQLMIQ